MSEDCYLCNVHAWTTELCDSCKEKLMPPIIPTKYDANWKCPVDKYEMGGISLVLPPGTRPSPFYQLLVTAADLHNKKNRNYAGEGTDPFRNFRECEDFGIPAWKGILVRLSDKWMRIKNLADGVEDQVGEDITETLIDLLVYAGLCINLIEENAECQREVVEE